MSNSAKVSNRSRVRGAAIALLFLACAVPAYTEPMRSMRRGDINVELPLREGERFHRSAFAAGPQGFATTLHLPDPESRWGVIMSSRVVQWSTDGFVTTDFDGKVGWLEYSPDGSSLLAASSPRTFDDPPSCHATELIFSLVNNDGELQWSHTVPAHKTVRFTADGAALAVNSFREIVILNLDGDELRHYERKERGTTLILNDTGEQLRLTDAHIVRENPTTTPTEEQWRIPLPGELGIHPTLSGLGPELFQLKRSEGFSVARIDTGQAVFNYDVHKLAKQDLSRTPSAYYGFSPFLDSTDPNLLLLFDGSSHGFEVQLGDGCHSPLIGRNYSVTRSEEFNVKKFIDRNRMFLVSDDVVVIRRLSSQHRETH